FVLESRRGHKRCYRDWSSDVCSSDLKICVIDTRLSNTASKADYWLSSWPGSEAAILLALCNILLQEELFDREFVRKWVNWEEYRSEERRVGKEWRSRRWLEACRQKEH